MASQPHIESSSNPIDMAATRLELYKDACPLKKLLDEAHTLEAQHTVLKGIEAANLAHRKAAPDAALPRLSFSTFSPLQRPLVYENVVVTVVHSFNTKGDKDDLYIETLNPDTLNRTTRDDNQATCSPSKTQKFWYDGMTPLGY